MDNKAYLKSIAVAPPPQKKQLDYKLSKILKFTGITTVIVILLIIGASFVRDFKKRSIHTIYAVNRISSELDKTITTINPSLKSPNIRKFNASLKTTLLELSTSTTNYLNSFKKKPKDKKSSYAPPLGIKKSIENNFFNLNVALEDARLNAHLDRTFLEQITYQISLLISKTKATQAHRNSFPKELNNAIIKAQENLNALLSDYSNFSDPSL